eukprot:187650-Prymnesium_polylepis.2
MHTPRIVPVRILTTSRSVNPVARATYDAIVSRWEGLVAEKNTIYARKRLEEAKVVRDRNRTQQCMRVQIIAERNGHTLRAISEPFVVVANLTKAKKKQTAKRQKTHMGLLPTDCIFRGIRKKDVTCNGKRGHRRLARTIVRADCSMLREANETEGPGGSCPHSWKWLSSSDSASWILSESRLPVDPLFAEGTPTDSSLGRYARDGAKPSW